VRDAPQKPPTDWPTVTPANPPHGMNNPKLASCIQAIRSSRWSLVSAGGTVVAAGVADSAEKSAQDGLQADLMAESGSGRNGGADVME